MRFSLSALLLFALIAASLCGALMACMDSFTHHSILASANPVPVMVVMTFMLIMGVALTIAAPSHSLFASLNVIDRNRGPDVPLWRPLQLAFSDGILHPKVF